MQKHISLQRQLELLRMEYEYEKAAFAKEAAMMGIDRKVKRGDCWYPISVGRSYYNSLDRFVVEIHSTAADDDVVHNFEYGRPVCFFEKRADGSLRYMNFQATVSYAEPTRMVVELPGEMALAELQNADLAGVMLHFDDYSYRVMLSALNRTIECRKGRVATLRDIFHTAAPASWSSASSVALSLPWLNASQEEAVRQALRAKDVLIVHGPPGTGKTTTLVETVCEVLKRESQVLVCAQSNTAVDWMCSQLAQRGVPILRIGNPTRVTPEMLAHTYEHRFAAHPDYPDLWQLRRTIKQLYAQPRGERAANFHQKIARLRERADELEVRIREALFSSSRVVSCTLTGAANPLLVGQHFHTLFIDEAAQALEAACWIPLQRADRVIFAGDHQQLPPTIKCPEALRSGLGITLMEQLAARKPECVHLLTVQYRMNEALMRFSSDWFYGGKLTAAPDVKHRSLLDELDVPIEWHDTTTQSEPSATADAEEATPVVPTTHHEEFIGNSYGRINKAEARLTIAALHNYVDKIGMLRLLSERIDIGVISPYRAQVHYLRSLIKHDAKLKPLKKHITIDTVDAFQGQERDVIIVSMVRDNAEGQIGFLSDLRRMNVAITRARYKLIVLGSTETLCRHPFYKKLYEACEAQKGDCRGDSPARDC